MICRLSMVLNRCEFVNHRVLKLSLMQPVMIVVVVVVGHPVLNSDTSQQNRETMIMVMMMQMIIDLLRPLLLSADQVQH